MIVLLDLFNYNFHNWMIFGDLKLIYYNIYYNNYNYLKKFIILIYTFVDRRHTFGYAIWLYQIREGVGIRRGSVIGDFPLSYSSRFSKPPIHQ